MVLYDKFVDFFDVITEKMSVRRPPRIFNFHRHIRGVRRTESASANATNLLLKRLLDEEVLSALEASASCRGVLTP